MAGEWPTSLGGLPAGFTSFPFPAGDPRTFSTFFTKSSTSAVAEAVSTSSETTSAARTKATDTQSLFSPPSYPTHTGYPYKDDDDSFLDSLDGGPRAGVGIAVTLGIIIIVALSVWYCCGCCGLRARRRKLREGLRAPDINAQRPVPLNTMNAPPPAPGDAPPQYEEAVPPRHQHIAGGARHIQRVEEDDAVISDGKTPLSEIPFEDVVLDHSPSEGSSRSFSDRHHGLGGDTRGHTNT